MPLHYCHPSAPHKKLNVPEWYVSDLMLERALDAIIRRLRRLDRDHDIPYLAGYSMDGTIIYIDRHMPMSFKNKGRTIETDRFLIRHEEVEKTMIDRLNLHYRTPIRLRPGSKSLPCSPVESTGTTTMISCRQTSNILATNALPKSPQIST
jgi:hypothetical protein